MLLILMQDSWWMPDASDRDGSNTIMSLCVCVYIYIVYIYINKYLYIYI